MIVIGETDKNFKGVFFIKTAIRKLSTYLSQLNIVRRILFCEPELLSFYCDIEPMSHPETQIPLLNKNVQIVKLWNVIKYSSFKLLSTMFHLSLSSIFVYGKGLQAKVIIDTIYNFILPIIYVKV